ncbi:NAD-dependent epimerase/dehydratase family protein [Pedobacter immunditicola]|uniref:polysaccharide biosynthesis C-terminal domain-containing protein n=1 Tax=Pedobacter immunditicola TaxID=3133440 RepID=UPI0030A059C9
MIKVGITGQNGFLGNHLYNTLSLFAEEFQKIPFEKDFFEDDQKLNDFVGKCDVIVHLAAMNRHNDPQVIYNNNIDLVNKLITALEHTGSKSHVLFSSSSQEENDNLYGKSKKEGRKLLSDWAKRSGGKFTGMIIPNVFGPFGNPYYNSFIATFCHQLTHEELPKIETDADVKLIYVDDLVELIIKEIKAPQSTDVLQIAANEKRTVSEILQILKNFKDAYLDSGIIPQLKDRFELNLFNTFRSYIDIKNHYPVMFTSHKDPRGAFVEIIRLNVGGQVSFSTTVPGITRGNHYHTRKIERFAVIKGEALIQLRKIGTEDILNFKLSGSEPAYVDMPIWYTHNIKNTGDEELYTIFWINEFFDPNDPDTFFENV